MKFGEAWNQAAETTGVDQVGVEMSFGFGLFLLSLELIWWVGIGLFIKLHHQPIDVDSDEL